MNTSEQINSVVDNFSEKLGPVLDELAYKLGSSAEYLFEIGTRHMIAQGVGMMIIAMFFIVLAIVTGRIMYRGMEEMSDDELFMGTLIFSIIPIIIGMVVLYFSILKLISPEYSFILSILEKIN
jgi:Trk-type K+ transport system membrane component